MKVDVNAEVARLRELYALGEAELKKRVQNSFDTPAAGGWSAAQHLEHVIKVNASVSRLIPALLAGKFALRSAPAKPKRLTELYAGRFPKGGTSPEDMQPGSGSDLTDLERNWAASLNTVSAFEGQDLTSDYRLEHVFYGSLNAGEWLRFMGVHTRHHLNLIGASA